MNINMKVVKFEMMIKNIEKKLVDPDSISDWVQVIYDYSKLNDFGKTILKIILNVDKKHWDDAIEHIEVEEWVDTWWKEGVVHNYIEGVNEDRGKAKIYFIFWALMILAVDDTDKEEHLSLICDFARILNISDVEMMDVVKIVRLVFHKEIDGNIVSYKVFDYFEQLLGDYGYSRSDFLGIELDLG